jgi:hypothetical protein
MNYDYISTQLCENTDKPEMKCNGTCHLKNELAKEANSIAQKTNDSKSHIITVEVLFCENIKPFDMNRFYKLTKKTFTNYQSKYLYLGTTSIFRPPILV